MKKTLLYCLLLTIFISSTNKTFAQNLSFEKDKNYVSLTYGFGAFYTLYFSATEDAVKQNTSNQDIKFTTSSLGPISLKYERAISEKIGLGLTFNYLSNSINYTDFQNTSPVNYELSRSTYSILARLNLHFMEHEKFDPYWGLGMGYRTEWWKQTVNSSDPSINQNEVPTYFYFPFGFETVIGARYFLNPDFALMTEFGLAKAVLQFGITGKF